MKLHTYFLMVSIPILLFFSAPYSTSMQPQPPAVQPVTLTQEAKIFLAGFILGSCMILVEHVESSSLAVMGLERIPFMGRFVRVLPLVILGLLSLQAGGIDITKDITYRSVVIAASGLMLGWSIGEGFLQSGGQLSLENFLQELGGNFANVAWRFDVRGAIESTLPLPYRLILKYLGKRYL